MGPQMFNLKSRMRASFAIPLVIFVTAASCRERTPEGQVVAIVNGVEVTASELTSAIGGQAVASGAPQGDQSADLERLIDLELLAQEAQRRRLDQDPTVLSAQIQYRRRSLAQSLMTMEQRDAPVPSNGELTRFIRDHPGWFQARRILLVERVSLDSLPSPATMALLNGADSLDAIQLELSRAQIGSFRQLVSWDTAELSQPLLEQLATVQEGRVFIVAQARPVLAGRIVQAFPAPIPENSLRAFALAKFEQQRAQLKFKSEITRLRRKGKIVYQVGYAPRQD